MNINHDQIAEINRAATLGASKALERLIGAPVTIGTVHLEVKKVSELLQVVDPKEVVVNVEIPLSGDVKGDTTLLMPVETAFGLVDVLLKKKQGTIRQITGEAKGVLKETANIVIGSYLKEFARARPGITLLHGQSRLSSGQFDTITRTLLPTLLPYEGEGLLIEIIFGFQHAVLKGYVILVFAGVEWNKRSV